jgi:hypothetical protein
LLRDKTRKPGKTPIAAATTARVVALTGTTPPHQATLGPAARWPKRPAFRCARCNASGRPINCSRIACVPSNIRAILVLLPSSPTSSGFMSIPHAVVLSLDEKSQIQALDRTQPGLPIKPGRCQTMTHDYKRHGTTTLFAALSVLDGRVIGRCMQRHRYSEFIRFLNAVERDVPAGKLVHAVLDNYATHKHPRVLTWLSRHPRWTFHFAPTSASWLNAVENYFSKITRQPIRRSVFRSIVDLQSAINAYLAEHNAHPKRFVWTASAEAIRAKLDRVPVLSECV